MSSGSVRDLSYRLSMKLARLHYPSSITTYSTLPSTLSIRTGVQAFNVLDDVGMRHLLVNADFSFDGFFGWRMLQIHDLQSEVLPRFDMLRTEYGALLTSSEVVQQPVVPNLASNG